MSCVCLDPAESGFKGSNKHPHRCETHTWHSHILSCCFHSVILQMDASLNLPHSRLYHSGRGPNVSPPPDKAHYPASCPTCAPAGIDSTANLEQGATWQLCMSVLMSQNGKWCRSVTWKHPVLFYTRWPLMFHLLKSSLPALAARPSISPRPGNVCSLSYFLHTYMNVLDTEGPGWLATRVLRNIWSFSLFFTLLDHLFLQPVLIQLSSVLPRVTLCESLPPWHPEIGFARWCLTHTCINRIRSWD